MLLCTTAGQTVSTSLHSQWAYCLPSVVAALILPQRSARHLVLDSSMLKNLRVAANIMHNIVNHLTCFA